MYQINNFTNNDDVKLLDSMGPFTVIEYQKDLSVMPGSAQLAYYCNAMNVRKRQVICDLSKACSPAFTAAVSRAFFLTRECRYLKTAAMSAGAPRRQSH